MIKINLLPWREAHSKKQKITFIIGLAVSIVLTILIAIAIDFVLAQKVKQQKIKNTALKRIVAEERREIGILRNKTKDSVMLMQKMGEIRNLGHQQLIGINLLNDIAKVVSESVVLKKLARQGEAVVLQGEANTHKQIAELIQQIREINGVSQVHLHEATSNVGKKGEATQKIVFELQFNLMKGAAGPSQNGKKPNGTDAKKKK